MQTVAEIAKARGIWDYEAQPKERLDSCNLCGAFWTFAPLVHDRYGFPVRIVRCNCGLVFIMERMTREAYARFYETAYRPLVSAFHGREINAQTIQPEQIAYGHTLGKILVPWMDVPNFRMEPFPAHLDIGGSTGVVALVVSAHLHGTDVTILDPSVTELEHAEDMRVFPVMIEDFNPLGSFDLITLCQTADHLLDLMGALKKIRGLLSPDGLFWADIVDFDKTREVKIDHPFNLTEKTFRAFLSKAGFNLLQVNYAPDGVHIGFLCKATA